MYELRQLKNNSYFIDCPSRAGIVTDENVGIAAEDALIGRAARLG